MSSKASNARYADSYRMYPYEPVGSKREMSLTQQVMVVAAISAIIVLILF